jgi:hypothetical protein
VTDSRFGWRRNPQEIDMKNIARVAAGATLLGLVLAATSARAELSPEELAKLAQNPVGNLISLPFQNNTNFDFGPLEKTQNVLNIQPVYPIHVNADWNVITRTIMPLLWQPALYPGQGSTFGLSDVQFSAFLSPASPGDWIWGAGAIAQLPTNTDDVLGNDNWGLGPTAVLLHMQRGNPWVYGALINNVWSVTDSNDAAPINQMLLQPFLNYNFTGGTYLTVSPIVTANWEADGGDVWTVPLGGGVGHIFHFGKLPVNTQVAGYYNVATPEFGADWQLRFQVQLMFPK